MDQLTGLGHRMPGTSLAFTIGAFGMIGLPPTAGFISKWQLGVGALESDHPWVVAVLVASSLLNSMYFLPIVYRLWFRKPDWDGDSGSANDSASPVTSPVTGGATPVRVREPKALLVPALLTAAATVAFGVVASVPFAPLQIAGQIAEGVFH